MIENSPKHPLGALLDGAITRPKPSNDFFFRLQKRWENQREVPLAALIYGLIDVHRKRISKKVEKQTDKDQLGLPGVLDWFYNPDHHKRRKELLLNPNLLKYVVDRYGAEHRAQTWEFMVWRAIAELNCCANSGKTRALINQIIEFIALLDETKHRIPDDQASKACVLYRLYTLFLYIAMPYDTSESDDDSRTSVDQTGLMREALEVPRHSLAERKKWCSSTAEVAGFNQNLTKLFELACQLQDQQSSSSVSNVKEQISEELEDYFPLECKVLNVLLSGAPKLDEGEAECRHCHA